MTIYKAVSYDDYILEPHVRQNVENLYTFMTVDPALRW
jgi:hypothetical protein